MTNRPQNKNLTPKPENLGVKPLAPGMKASKAFRFTLPVALVERLESMTKAERDELLKRCLEQT